MSTVDKVIFDALAKRQNVVLPGVGSLEVKRRKAKKVSDNRIIPPQNVVVFNTEEIAEGESIVYLLATSEDTDDREARAKYKSWLEEAASDKGLNIRNVGEISDEKFVIAQPLHAALNPSKDEVIVMEEKEDKGGSPFWLWLVCGLLLAFIAYMLLSYYLSGSLFGIEKKPKAVTTEVVAPVADTLAVNQPTSEEVIAETMQQQAAAAAPAQHRFHVIAGSFSVEKNADNFMKKVQRDFPDLKLEKLKNPRNGYWMVSIFNAPTERQAYNKIKMYWDIDLNLWVYEEK